MYFYSFSKEWWVHWLENFIRVPLCIVPITAERVHHIQQISFIICTCPNVLRGMIASCNQCSWSSLNFVKSSLIVSDCRDDIKFFFKIIFSPYHFSLVILLLSLFIFIINFLKDGNARSIIFWYCFRFFVFSEFFFSQ